MIRVEFVDSVRHAFSRLERATIRAACDDIDVEVRAFLPTLQRSIRLTIQDSPLVIPEHGCVGCALASDHVEWAVDTARHEGVLGIAGARLRPTLFHELHHLVRGWTLSAARWSALPGKGGEWVRTAIVSEGLATAFERDAAGHRAPWGDYPLNVLDWVWELLALPAEAIYSQWMFEHTDGRRWIGYRAGTYLADRAIAASRRSAAQLVTTPAEEILALALPCG